MIGAVLALIAAAAPGVVTPKPVLQIGHEDPAPALAWLPGGRHVLTVSPSSAIIWETATGTELDFIRMPLAQPDETVAVLAARSSSEGNVTIFTRITAAGPENDTPPFCRRYLFDKTTRAITKAAEARGGSDAGLTARACAALAGTDPFARGRTAVRLPDGWLLQGQRGKPLVALRNIAVAKFDRAYVSPDGQLIAHLSRSQKGPLRTYFEVRSTVTGQLYPRVTANGSYARIIWMTGTRYAAVADVARDKDCEAVPGPDALTIDATSGSVAERIPARRNMAPLGGTGAMIAAGRSDCASPSRGDALIVRQPGGQWRALATPEIAGQAILKLAVAPGGRAVATASYPAATAPGPAPDRTLTVFRGDFLDPAEPAGQRLAAPIDPNHSFTGLGFSRDDSRLMALVDDTVRVWDVRNGQQIADIRTEIEAPTFFSADADFLVVGRSDRPDMLVFRIADGRQAAKIPAGGFIDGGILPGRGTLWTAARNGAIRLYRTRDGRQMLSMFRLPGDGFVTLGSSGRYDTDLGPDTKLLRWLMPDRPWQSLGPQTFMRDYYRPQLMARTLACIAADNCETALPPLPPVAGLNRVLPEVTGLRITPASEPGVVTVDVTVANGRAVVPGGNDRSSGVHDLRLFRSGKLVAELPDPGNAVPQQAGDWRTTVEQWRNATAALDPAATAPGHARFAVRLPAGGKPLTFSAYAFNSDRIKGETVSTLYSPARPVPPHPPRAVVIAIGVNDAGLPDWHLNYAASDATAIASALAAIPDHAVTTIALTSAGGVNTATKAVIRAVLLALGGQAGPDERAALAGAGIDPAKLAPVTPDDLVVLSFSGHGDSNGDEFYLLPSDGKPLADRSPDHATMISSAELTAWLRHVDAGETGIIIDACHSAAATSAGDYKPGPMGDPGLGQLAFDKGIRILAATQADNVALEDAGLGHGVLTHVLVDEGLGPQRAAAPAHDGRVPLLHWLRFAVAKLPEFTAHTAAADDEAHDMEPYDTAAIAPPPPQQPSLFDFDTARRSKDLTGPRR